MSNSLFGFFAQKFKFANLLDTPASPIGYGGYFVKVKSDETGLEYDSGGSATGLITWQTEVAAVTLDDTHLIGGVGIHVNIATANDFTIPTGLTGLRPVIVSNYGAGPVTFVASGSSLRSAGGALTLRTQYSTAVIFPLGSSEYLLAGDFDVAP